MAALYVAEALIAGKPELPTLPLELQLFRRLADAPPTSIVENVPKDVEPTIAALESCERGAIE